MMKEEIDRQCELLGSNTEPELQLLFSLKAINVIYSAISNKQLEFVCEEDTAYKIIKKLNIHIVFERIYSTTNCVEITFFSKF